MQKFLDILKLYWGYDDFRPLQGDIIRSIFSGKDTLGLMPTGGGKSLTFQVPAMAMDGVCLVVTPLIALMKDQVDNLKKRNIQAAAIFSGMSHDDILLVLENASNEAYKFLYISPERLKTSVFIQKLSHIKVCLIAVDESHCISQWGYDFRPSYLCIADIRSMLPEVPVLALTATATHDVIADIQQKLQFSKPNVFRKSFHRSNLAYIVRTTDKKEEQLLSILQKVPGTSVVYVRNRKKTKEIADFLVKNGVTANYFHAGLKHDLKDERQNKWMSGEVRVIVSTNAFGMGIDKSEVRTVIHMDLPDSLEAYYQEAGRAGRDELKAYAILLYNKSDAAKIKKRIADNFPPKEGVCKIYDSLGSYFQIGVGSGLNSVFPFDIADFCFRYKFSILIAYNALKIMQHAGYIELTDEQDSLSRVFFRIDKDELYSHKQTSEQEQLTHILLRSYTGLFSEPAYINEEIIAKRLQWTRTKVYDQLILMAKAHIIQYIPRKKTPYITFIREREDINRIQLGKNAYDDRLVRYKDKVDKVLQYAQEEDHCRSQMLLHYFGETDAKHCGHCDVCLKKRQTEMSTKEFDKIQASVLTILSREPLSLHMLIRQLDINEQKALKVLRFLIDNGHIEENKQLKLTIRSV